MKRYLARLGRIGIIALAAALVWNGPAPAAITVLDQYYLGEADGPGAVDGSVPLITTDSIGSLDLAEQTNTRPSVISTYTSNVSAGATAHTGSNLAIQFSNANGHEGSTDTLYSAPARATAATDNFGIEGWFKVTENRTGGIVAFNGSAGFNGFGLMVNQTDSSGNFTYQGFYGGSVGFLDSRVPVTLDSWVYMAMVRDSGVTSLYVNNTTPITPFNPFTGLPNPSITPLAASQGFGIGGDVSGNDTFAGGIDEVRVFTFAPGQFSTSDLLISQTLPPPSNPTPPPESTTQWSTNSNGAFADSSYWGNGVPDTTKTAVFRRGAGVSYTVAFTNAQPNNVSDRLMIGSNNVTFAPSLSDLNPTSTYSVVNTTTAEVGRGLIIGQLTGDTAVLTTKLPSFTVGAATLADAPHSQGTLNVTNTVFNSGVFSVGDFIVGRSGAGALNVTGGGTVSVTRDTIMGEYTGSSGTATVSGAGSTWTNGGELWVGDLGHGALNVNGGGQVSSNECLIGRQAGSVGLLNITNGGQVSSTDGYVGTFSGSSGTATVDGGGSNWSNSTDLYVGYLGAGTLSVTNGGRVSNRLGAISPGGTASVVGTDSNWINSSSLSVEGTLTISGGHVVSGTASIGRTGSTVAATVSVDSQGTLAIGVVFDIGEKGPGALGITGGGQVTTNTDGSNPNVRVRIGGKNSLYPGAVNVAGAGSKWTNKAGNMYVGINGTGTLEVTGGGLVANDSGTSALNNAFIGGDSLLASGIGIVNIDGAGSEWTNHGSLTVGAGGNGTLNITNGADVVDLSSSIGIAAGSTGIVTVDGTGSIWTNSHDVSLGNVSATATGTLTVTNGGEVHVAGSLFVNRSGKIHGNGLISGYVQNGGLVSPGNSPGALHIGSYAQTNDGKLLIELAGTAPGTQYDQLLINLGATLDGTLQVSFIGGFAPSSGDSFDLLTTFSGITGTFANPQLPMLAGGLVWNLNYGPNDLILSVGGALGDYNHNGIVDAADYIVWRKTLGQSGAGLAADGNNNGTIDPGDLDAWRAHFGQTAGSGAGATAGLPSSAVPEPATVTLFLMGFVIAGVVFRIRARRLPWITLDSTCKG